MAAERAGQGGDRLCRLPGRMRAGPSSSLKRATRSGSFAASCARLEAAAVGSSAIVAFRWVLWSIAFTAVLISARPVDCSFAERAILFMWLLIWPMKPAITFRPRRYRAPT